MLSHSLTIMPLVLVAALCWAASASADGVKLVPYTIKTRVEVASTQKLVGWIRKKIKRPSYDFEDVNGDNRGFLEIEDNQDCILTFNENESPRGSVHNGLGALTCGGKFGMSNRNWCAKGTALEDQEGNNQYKVVKFIGRSRSEHHKYRICSGKGVQSKTKDGYIYYYPNKKSFWGAAGDRTVLSFKLGDTITVVDEVPKVTGKPEGGTIPKVSNDGAVDLKFDIDGGVLDDNIFRLVNGEVREYYISTYKGKDGTDKFKFIENENTGEDKVEIFTAYKDPGTDSYSIAAPAAEADSQIVVARFFGEVGVSTTFEQGGRVRIEAVRDIDDEEHERGPPVLLLNPKIEVVENVK